MKALRTFTQEPWHEQHTVVINEGAIVTIDGLGTTGRIEQALAWVILRLNAETIQLRRHISELELALPH